MIDQDLIKKFLSGNCTQEELLLIRKYMDDENWAMNELDRMWQTSDHQHICEDEDKFRNLKLIRKKSDYSNIRRSRNWVFESSVLLRVAAILLIAFAVPLMLIDQEAPRLVEKNQAVLVTKSNPAGRKSTICLPDGSIVRLNAASEISYPEQFTDSMRQVSLKGEAFFDVTENPDKPFLVNTDGLITKVLGTSFNINAFMENEAIEVVLASGKVEIQKSNQLLTTLLPGEEIIYDNRSHSYRKQMADIEKTLAWKNNLVIFDKASSSEIFAYLERWYGVEFVIDKKVISGQWRFSGRYQDESLENILLSLSYVKSFNFRINKKMVYITL